MEDLLKQIQTKIEEDTRSSEEIYSMLKQLGTYMFMTNTLSRDNVILFCSSLIKLYLNLKLKE